MQRIALIALAGIVSVPALATGRLAEVRIVDRDTGQVLPTHHYRGEYWVAGRPGAHYAIQIHSRDHGRLLAVASVDGVNVITGETAAHDQRGYVFHPWQGYDIAGWRKSNAEIAAFTFTSVPKSYAARTGRAANVGVIGVALFREWAPPPPPPMVQALPAPLPPAAPPMVRAEAEDQSGAAQDRAAPQESRAANAASRRESAAAERSVAQSLGTGHGRREHSVVTQTNFERAQSTPDEVIRIRYDSEANLVAMGVIRRTPPRPRPLDPFPDSPRMGYVPDP